MLLLGGLLACGETPSDAEVSSETEQSVEVLQVTSGKVKIDSKRAGSSQLGEPPPTTDGKELHHQLFRRKNRFRGKLDTLCA